MAKLPDKGGEFSAVTVFFFCCSDMIAAKNKSIKERGSSQRTAEWKNGSFIREHIKAAMAAAGYVDHWGRADIFSNS